ncbi:hypothetical protein Tco_0937651 [Tanacetum coccineum]|uniref:Uncharacterized protein n=1 Tax=Tanacetum coccineum TaxID=301880 RepID=A0ABQ5DHP1_9ASTR
MVPRAVLMKSSLVSINTARLVNAAHTKTTMNAARPMSYLSKKAHSNVKRPIHKNTTFKKSQARKETKPVNNYILLPLWPTDPPYSQDPKSSQDDGSKPLSDDGKKVGEDSRKDSEGIDKEKEDNVNSSDEQCRKIQLGSSAREVVVRREDEREELTEECGGVEVLVGYVVDIASHGEFLVGDRGENCVLRGV